MFSKGTCKNGLVLLEYWWVLSGFLFLLDTWYFIVVTQGRSKAETSPAFVLTASRMCQVSCGWCRKMVWSFNMWHSSFWANAELMALHNLRVCCIFLEASVVIYDALTSVTAKFLPQQSPFHSWDFLSRISWACFEILLLAIPPKPLEVSETRFPTLLNVFSFSYQFGKAWYLCWQRCYCGLCKEQSNECGYSSA